MAEIENKKRPMLNRWLAGVKLGLIWRLSKVNIWLFYSYRIKYFKMKKHKEAIRKAKDRMLKAGAEFYEWHSRLMLLDEDKEPAKATELRIRMRECRDYAWKQQELIEVERKAIKKILRRSAIKNLFSS